MVTSEISFGLDPCESRRSSESGLSPYVHEGFGRLNSALSLAFMYCLGKLNTKKYDAINKLVWHYQAPHLPLNQSNCHAIISFWVVVMKLQWCSYFYEETWMKREGKKNREISNISLWMTTENLWSRHANFSDGIIKKNEYIYRWVSRGSFTKGLSLCIQ
jgi:hypothetical protein